LGVKLNPNLEFCGDLETIVNISLDLIAASLDGSSNALLLDSSIPVQEPSTNWDPPTLAPAIARRLIQNEVEVTATKKTDNGTISGLVEAKEVPEIQVRGLEDVKDKKGAEDKEREEKVETVPAEREKPRRRRNPCTWVLTGIPHFELPATRLEFGRALAKYRPYGTIEEKTTLRLDYSLRKGRPSPLCHSELPAADASPEVPDEDEIVSDASSEVTAVEAPPSRMRRFWTRVLDVFKKKEKKDKIEEAEFVEIKMDDLDPSWRVPATYTAAFEKFKPLLRPGYG